MARDNMDRGEAIKDVLEGLQWLILHHSTSTAREQYAPSLHSDASDDHIKENKEWVAQLRKIRGEFEDLVTGLL